MQAQVINQRIRRDFERLLLECLTSGVQKGVTGPVRSLCGLSAALAICGANVYPWGEQLAAGYLSALAASYAPASAEQLQWDR